MKEEDSKDSELIKRYLSGDKASLALLVERWHSIFCEKAFWVLKNKDTVKDVAQESWIVIINKLHTLKNADSFKSWALRIVYNKAIDAYNKSRKESIQDIYTKLDSEVFINTSENEERKALQMKLLSAIQNLPKDKQEVIRLFYVEEYSLKEISSLLQIPLGTTKSRLFKAREKLKSIIKSYDYEK